MVDATVDAIYRSALECDRIYQAPSYEAEEPLEAGGLRGKTEWFDSLRRIEELERRHDAEIEDGWGH